MIVFSEGSWWSGPNCGYNEPTGWLWDDEAYGHVCPKCSTMVSAETGAIIKHRLKATVFYKKGRGWMVSIRHPAATTIAGPFISKENAITEAKRDNPDEITVIDT